MVSIQDEDGVRDSTEICMSIYTFYNYIQTSRPTHVYVLQVAMYRYTVHGNLLKRNHVPVHGLAMYRYMVWLCTST